MDLGNQGKKRKKYKEESFLTNDFIGENNTNLDKVKKKQKRNVSDTAEICVKSLTSYDNLERDLTNPVDFTVNYADHITLRTKHKHRQKHIVRSIDDTDQIVVVPDEQKGRNNNETNVNDATSFIPENRKTDKYKELNTAETCNQHNELVTLPVFRQAKHKTYGNIRDDTVECDNLLTVNTKHKQKSDKKSYLDTLYENAVSDKPDKHKKKQKMDKKQGDINVTEKHNKNTIIEISAPPFFDANSTSNIISQRHKKKKHKKNEENKSNGTELANSVIEPVIQIFDNKKTIETEIGTCTPAQFDINNIFSVSPHRHKKKKQKKDEKNKSNGTKLSKDFYEPVKVFDKQDHHEESTEIQLNAPTISDVNSASNITRHTHKKKRKKNEENKSKGTELANCVSVAKFFDKQNDNETRINIPVHSDLNNISDVIPRRHKKKKRRKDEENKSYGTEISNEFHEPVEVFYEQDQQEESTKIEFSIPTILDTNITPHRHKKKKHKKNEENKSNSTELSNSVIQPVVQGFDKKQKSETEIEISTPADFDVNTVSNIIPHRHKKKKRKKDDENKSNNTEQLNELYEPVDIFIKQDQQKESTEIELGALTISDEKSAFNIISHKHKKKKNEKNKLNDIKLSKSTSEPVVEVFDKQKENDNEIEISTPAGFDVNTISNVFPHRHKKKKQKTDEESKLNRPEMLNEFSKPVEVSDKQDHPIKSIEIELSAPAISDVNNASNVIPHRHKKKKHKRNEENKSKGYELVNCASKPVQVFDKDNKNETEIEMNTLAGFDVKNISNVIPHIHKKKKRKKDDENKSNNTEQLNELYEPVDIFIKQDQQKESTKIELGALTISDEKSAFNIISHKHKKKKHKKNEKNKLNDIKLSKSTSEPVVEVFDKQKENDNEIEISTPAGFDVNTISNVFPHRHKRKKRKTDEESKLNRPEMLNEFSKPVEVSDKQDHPIKSIEIELSAPAISDVNNASNVIPHRHKKKKHKRNEENKSKGYELVNCASKPVQVFDKDNKNETEIEMNTLAGFDVKNISNVIPHRHKKKKRKKDDEKSNDTELLNEVFDKLDQQESTEIELSTLPISDVNSTYSITPHRHKKMKNKENKSNSTELACAIEPVQVFDKEKKTEIEISTHAGFDVNNISNYISHTHKKKKRKKDDEKSNGTKFSNDFYEPVEVFDKQDHQEESTDNVLNLPAISDVKSDSNNISHRHKKKIKHKRNKENKSNGIELSNGVSEPVVKDFDEQKENDNEIEISTSAGIGINSMSNSFPPRHKKKKRKKDEEKKSNSSEILKEARYKQDQQNEKAVFSVKNGLDLDFNDDPVPFEITPLHISEIVHPITQQQRDDMAAQGVVIKTGRYTRAEDETIKKNFEDFVHEFKVSDPVLLLGIGRVHRDKEFKKFVKAKHFYVRLAKGLDNRPLCSVYKRARSILHPERDSGRLNENEVQTLKKLTTTMRQNWHLIGDRIGKSASSCYETYRWHKKDVAKGKFTADEEKRLIKALTKVTGSSDISCKALKSISWNSVATRVPTRNASQCRWHWAMHLAWVPDSAKKKWDGHCYRKLIKVLSKKWNVDNASMIDWDKVHKTFQDVAPSPLYLQKRWLYLRSRVSNYQRKNYCDVLRILRNMFLKQKKVSNDDNFLNDSVVKSPV